MIFSMMPELLPLFRLPLFLLAFLSLMPMPVDVDIFLFAIRVLRCFRFAAAAML